MKSKRDKSKTTWIFFVFEAEFLDKVRRKDNIWVKGGLELKLEFVNAKKIDFVWLDKEVPRIAWDVGELEVLRADLGKNHNDLSKLEPRNAANLLKLFFVHIMDNDRDSEFAGLWGILKQKEKDTLDAALSGWGEYEIGLVLFNMVAVLHPINTVQ